MKNNFNYIVLFLFAMFCGYFIKGIENTPTIDYSNHKIDSLKVKYDSLLHVSESLRIKGDSIDRVYDTIILEIKNYNHEKIDYIKSLSVDSSIIFLRGELSRKDNY